MNLARAVTSGDESAVYSCLLRGEDPDEPSWQFAGSPPLLLAALQPNPQIIRYLCEAGCDVNGRNVCGETALHLVISSRKHLYLCINVLLDYGCDCSIQEKLRGMTPLHVLTKHIATSKDSSPEAIDTLHRLARLSNPFPTDYRGRTPLHYAVLYNAPVSCVQELLPLGANISNNRGETALHECLEADSSKEIIEILAKNTDLSLTNLYGESPLHIASRKGKEDIVRLLVDQGCEPNQQDMKGNSALHLAAERGYTSIVELLTRSSRVKLNIQNNEGLTPLHSAVESSFLNVVQVLLGAKECNVDATNKQSQTALDIAEKDYRPKSHTRIKSLIFEEMQKRKEPTI